MRVMMQLSKVSLIVLIVRHILTATSKLSHRNQIYIESKLRSHKLIKPNTGIIVA